MPSQAADHFEAAAAALRSGRGDADAALRRAVDLLMAGPPGASLGNLGTEAGWLASRTADRDRDDRVRVETAAAMIACLSGSATRAAAYAGSLTRWPSGLARLVLHGRERIDGTGPLSIVAGRQTPAGRRVAICVEAASVSRRLEGQAAEVVAHFARRAEAGAWDRRDVDRIAPAVAGLCSAHLAARREALAGRAFRISALHHGPQPPRQPKPEPHPAIPRPKLAGRLGGVRARAGAVR